MSSRPPWSHLSPLCHRPPHRSQGVELCFLCRRTHHRQLRRIRTSNCPRLIRAQSHEKPWLLLLLWIYRRPEVCLICDLERHQRRPRHCRPSHLRTPTMLPAGIGVQAMLHRTAGGSLKPRTTSRREARLCNPRPGTSLRIRNLCPTMSLPVMDPVSCALTPATCYTAVVMELCTLK